MSFPEFLWLAMYLQRQRSASGADPGAERWKEEIPAIPEEPHILLFTDFQAQH
jgi:hypothetical protein